MATRFPDTRLLLASLIILAFLPGLGNAQDATVVDPPPVEVEDGNALTVAGIEGEMVELDANSTLDETAKNTIKATYQKAIDVVKSGDAFRTQAGEFAAALETAPEGVETINEEIAGLPENPKPVDEFKGKDFEVLQKEIDRQQADLSLAKSRLVEVEAEISKLNQRPVEINERLPKLQDELAKTEADLKAPRLNADSSPARTAEKILLEATKESLVAEAAALEKERLSRSVRVRLVEANRDLLTRKVELATAHVDALKVLANRQLRSDSEKLAVRAGLALKKVPTETASPAILQLKREVEKLANDLPELARELQKLNKARDGLAVEMDGLANESRRLRDQAEMGGLEGAFTQIFRQQLRQLPNANIYRSKSAKRHKELDMVRLQAFGISQMMQDQARVEGELKDGSAEIQDLLAIRRELLKEMKPSTMSLVNEVALLDAGERRYIAEVQKFRSFLTEMLFWARDSPAVNMKTLTTLPSSVRWVFSPKRFSELGPAIRGIGLRQPALTVTVVLVIGFLIVKRRKISSAIKETGVQVRAISTDSFGHTLRAFALTLLLVIPLPLAVGYVGWAMGRDPTASEWLRGLAVGLYWSSFMIFSYLLVMSSCHAGGLGIAHFGWRESTALRFRRSLIGILVVFIPALLIFFSTFYEEDPRHMNTVGLVAFVISHLWLAILAVRLLSPSNGVFANIFREHPNRLFTRFANLWFFLVASAPIFLIVIACLGYLLTAQAITFVYMGTLGIVAGGVLFYGLSYRWFNVKERKLALEEALERRRARRESVKEEAVSEDEVLPAAEDVELDISDVGRQTRRLLRSVISVGVIVAIGMFWTATMPFEESLNEISVFGGLTLLGLAQGALILVVTTVIVRNLPGLLELLGLREKDLDPGLRNAIATIAQYLAAAIGAMILFNVLNLDWTKFGWMAAALSVGIGFGLQEIVANFICGIILLFERPIRVGDVITVDGVSGTVTKLRMRATTVTNWDRQEFIVPNKNFITGTLLNWTLTSSTNRIIIKVGVAYGSDTVKALEILDAVANSHPRILEDPAPLATFEGFGDSSLDLLLRSYIPELDGRLQVVTELHSEIDRRFREAGIEIPFPQRDLHVRSVDADVKLGGGVEES